jgi:hypothetical protein
MKVNTGNGGKDLRFISTVGETGEFHAAVAPVERTDGARWIYVGWGRDDENRRPSLSRIEPQPFSL